jgi:integrase
MNLREPTLRKKTNGAFFVRWGGKDHYLAMREADAVELFEAPRSQHPGSLAAWRRWSDERRGEPSVPVWRRTGRLTLHEASKLMLKSYLALGRPEAHNYFRSHLKRFLSVHLNADLIDLTTADPASGRFVPPITALLRTFTKEMASVPKKDRLGTRTINHDVLAVKRLINWCHAEGLCPAVSFAGVKRLPARRGTPEWLTPEEIIEKLNTAAKAQPELVPYLVLNYLCCARPSEVVTMVRRKGELLPVYDAKRKVAAKVGIFSLSQHKSTWRGEHHERPVVLTEEAHAWLMRARPYWKRPSSYSAACERAGLPGLPHQLRDSAATHLEQRGVELADISRLLGHAPRGEWPSYVQSFWLRLRGLADRISLQTPLRGSAAGAVLSSAAPLPFAKVGNRTRPPEWGKGSPDQKKARAKDRAEERRKKMDRERRA